MRKIIALLSTLLFAVAAQAGGDSGGKYLMVKSKQGNFEDVRDDLVMAIESRGIKINHTNYIAKMLERTGESLGASKQVYGMGEQVEFCKSDLSRAQMEAHPANMAFCPYIISVYTLPQDAKTIYLAYRKPLAPGADKATLKALADVAKLLDEITDEATK